MSQTVFQPYFANLDKYTSWPRSSFLQPFSTKSQPFVQWARQPYAFVTQDFCHEKPFTAKIATKTGRSLLKIKESVSQKKGVTQLDDEVKLWFDLPNHGTLYTKVKSTDYIKVHYDHGLRSFNGRLFYLFGGFNSTKVLQNVNLRAGFGHVADNHSTENRLKISLGADDNQYHLYHKTYVAHKQARFGFITVVDLNRFVFQKNNLLFGWHFKDNTSAYLRAEVKGFRGHNPNFSRIDTVFDTLTANLTHNIDNRSKTALEATFLLRENKLDEAKAVYQFEYEPKKLIKVSLTNKLNFGLVAKSPLYGHEDIATLSAGVGVSLNNKDISLKTGFELNINL